MLVPQRWQQEGLESTSRLPYRHFDLLVIRAAGGALIIAEFDQSIGGGYRTIEILALRENDLGRCGDVLQPVVRFSGLNLLQMISDGKGHEENRQRKTNKERYRISVPAQHTLCSG